mmetsp:Transcript_25957/g.57002  ORF Transcript_25957/g.57002 Transcript_25957/m.57002 type:complete len:484 (+) Transcript_25957:73-1524(+)
MTSPNPCINLLPSRPWLYKLGVSGLANVPDAELDAVCQGIDILWLQGAWEVGKSGRLHDLAEPGRRKHFEECLPGDFVEEDCIGSPYAITRYTPSPELGTEEELAAFRQRLDSRGVQLMLDFVPNHSARDSPWIDANPGIYMPPEDNSPGAAYGRDPYSGHWTDTAQLNYWAPACREHMADQLASVAARCDGVRIDMAMLCCNDVIERAWAGVLGPAGYQRAAEEFWPWALSRAKQVNPSFYVLAECYEYEQIYPSGTGRLLISQGFDSVYDKGFYDRLTEGHMDNIRGHLFGPDKEFILAGKMCHFVENHDEERASAHFKERIAAATVASLTLPGARMVMWGQEHGFRERLAVHLRRAREEQPLAEIAAMYPKLIQAALPLCRGEWQILDAQGEESWRLLTWAWKNPTAASGASIVVVVVNFTDGEAWANLQVSHLISGIGEVQFTDCLTGIRYTKLASELESGGLYVRLNGFASHVFALVL